MPIVCCPNKCLYRECEMNFETFILMKYTVFQKCLSFSLLLLSFFFARSDDRVLEIVTHNGFGFLLLSMECHYPLYLCIIHSHIPNRHFLRSSFVSGNLSKSWEPTYSRWLPEIIIQPQCKSPTTLYNSPGKIMSSHENCQLVFFLFFKQTRKN